MSNNEIVRRSEIVTTELKKITFEYVEFKRNISDTDVTLGLKIDTNMYEYQIKNGRPPKRKIESWSLDFKVLEFLDNWFKNLQVLISDEEYTDGQMTIFDEESKIPKEDIVAISHLGTVVDDNYQDAQIIEETENVPEINPNEPTIESNEVVEAIFSEVKETEEVDAELVVEVIPTENELTDQVEETPAEVEEPQIEITEQKEESKEPYVPYCEKCGQTGVDLDINNECPECRKVDVYESNPLFGETVTASF